MRIRERVLFNTLGISGCRLIDEACSKKPEITGKDVQLERFVNLYRYAFLNNSFYNQKYIKAGLSVDSIKKYSDIQNVPYLRKDEIAVSNLITKKIKPAVSLASGGTTGKRVLTYLDKNCLCIRYKMLLSILYSMGWRIGDSTAALHPLEYGYFNNLYSMLKTGKLTKIIFDFIQQFIVYGMFHNLKNIYYDKRIFEENNAEYYLKQLSAKRPYLLRSRSDVINVLIKQAQAKGLALAEVNNILVVGNILTNTVRSNLEKAFNAKVYNLYASTEVGYVGLSCKYSGSFVHIDEHNYLVDINSNENNEIVITDFNNYAMPFIRYKTGDIGEIAEGICGCGSEKRRLKINGRKERFILNEKGEMVYDGNVVEFLEDYPLIWACQLHNVKFKSIRIIIRPRDIRRDYLDNFIDNFSKKFNIRKERIVCDFNSPLAMTASGKFCVII